MRSIAHQASLRTRSLSRRSGEAAKADHFGTCRIRSVRGIGKRFVYILRSDSDPSRYYVGVTSNVDERLEWHNDGPCGYTVENRPWSIVAARVQRARMHLRTALDECCRIALDRRGGIISYEARTDRCGTCQAPSETSRSESCPPAATSPSTGPAEHRGKEGSLINNLEDVDPMDCPRSALRLHDQGHRKAWCRY